MTLSEIEEKAQELLSAVLAEDHSSRAEHTYRKLRCLREVAQIIAVGDNRASWNAHAEMHEEELAAMQKVADATTQLTTAPKCGHRWQWYETADQEHFEICTLPATHVGIHRNGVTGSYTEYNKSGGEALNASARTKPAADRLHELLSYLVQQSEAAHQRSQEADAVSELGKSARQLSICKAYDDAATKLSEILHEGGI